MATPKAAIIVVNWNGLEDLPACLSSLQLQTQSAEIVVVDNGSVDGSVEFLTEKFSGITLLPQSKNYGFTGGVNIGMEYALKHNFNYIALFNNDAIADKNWLKHLVTALEKNKKLGIATCKLTTIDKSHIDSTGDIYTSWGLPYPRGRGEAFSTKYDKDTEIFGASGGASVYRSAMLREVGLMDDKYFAYYEDVDLSFRAQLAGWKVAFVPKSVAFHKIGGTSGKIKGFTTYQTMKNLPMAFWKNVPRSLMPIILPRFTLAYTLFAGRALISGRGIPAIKGMLVFIKNIPYIIGQRRSIQKNRRVSNDYIKSIITYDLPPNASALRALRNKWRKLIGKAK